LRKCRETPKHARRWRPGVHPIVTQLGDSAATKPDLGAQPNQRVILLVHDAFLHRNDRVVGDLDVLGADLRNLCGEPPPAESTSNWAPSPAALTLHRCPPSLPAATGWSCASRYAVNRVRGTPPTVSPQYRGLRTSWSPAQFADNSALSSSGRRANLPEALSTKI